MINKLMETIRNRDFVEFCKQLWKDKYTQKQIAQKAMKHFQLKSCSRFTVYRALREGVVKS